MTISKQFLSFTFGNLSQDKGAKHIVAGGLVNASNCLRGQSSTSKAGPLTKRRGFSRTAPTFSGASWTNATATAGHLLSGNGSSLLAVDGADRKWSYNAATTAFTSMGLVPPVFPRTTYAIPKDLRMVCTVLVGSNLWYFGHEAAANALGWYCVINATTGATVQAPTQWTLSSSLPSGLIDAPQLGAAYDNSTAVWVFDGTSAYKFVVATPSVAPTTTAFAISTVTGTAATFTGGVHCRWLSGISKIAVVGWGRSSAGAAGSFIQVAYLNTATGLKAVDVPAVSAATTGANFFGGRILVSDASNGSWYVADREFAGVSVVNTYLWTVTASSLALSTVSLGALTQNLGSAGSHGGYGGVCGYLADNGDRIVYASDINLDSPAGAEGMIGGKIRRYVRSGATTETTIQGGFVSSDPVKYGTDWYWISGGHDVRAAASYAGLQRSLHLRDTTGNIVCQMLNGSGASYGNTLLTAVPANSNDFVQCVYAHITDTVLVGTTIINGSCVNETSIGLVAARTVIEMAPAFPSPAKLSANAAMSAGGTPQAWSAIDAIHECAPMMFPGNVTRSAGAGATYTSVAACYAITDADGAIYRSAPYLGTLTFGASDTLVITPCHWKLPGTSVTIEIYGGTTTLRLIYAIASSTASGSQSIVLPAASGLIAGGETLYTTGGALSADPAFPASATYAWRNRIFAITPEIDPTRTAFSLEREFGFGPRFNAAALAFNWRDGTGEVLAFGAVDWNYLCLFKSDAIAVISGPGPDGRGAGNYTPQQLPTAHGCTALRSIVSGPGGCFFQSSKTGDIMCVTPGLAVVEATPGGTDYASEIVTAARHNEKFGLMQFYTANRIIVLDYMNPSETYPLGEVYSWSSSGLLQGFGATTDNTGPVHMEATGVLRRPETSVYQDATATTPASYGISVESGWVQPFQLQGEFSLRGVQALGEFRAAHTLQITTYADYAAAGEMDSVVVTATPEQFRVTPTGMMRVNAIKVKIEETASTGAGLDLEGWGIEVQNRGREKRLAVAQRI